MADAAARREARRRKILENSENRLLRISGRSSHEKPLAEKNDILSSNQGTHSVLSNHSLNGIFPRESLVNSEWDEDPLELENQINTDLLLSESENSHILSNKLNSIHDSVIHENGSIPGHKHRTGALHDYIEGSVFSTENHFQEFKKPEKLKQSKFHTLFTSRLIYIALAVAVNLMMILQLDSTYGKSIIPPFFVIFLTRLYIYGTIPESSKGNMMVAALILCNIRPSIIYTFQKIINTINLIVRDLSLYIVCFVIIFTTITKYCIGFDDSPPKKMEESNLYAST